MAKHDRTQNSRSTVRVLHFPASSPPAPASDLDSDALADAIRKAWTQKPLSGKRDANRMGARPARLAGSES